MTTTNDNHHPNNEALSDAFDRVRDEVEEELKAPRRALETVKRTLDAFFAKFEQHLVSDLISQIDLDRDERASAALDAAQALEDATRGLTGYVRGHLARAAAESAEAKAKALFKDFRSTNFAQLRDDDEFRWVAQKFAAAARLIQDDLGERSQDAPEVRVIRALTRLCSDRQIDDVFGLCRHHKDDWHGRIKQAESELEAIRALARSRLSDADLGRLRIALRGRPIVVVGGEVRSEKLDRLKTTSRLNVEWTPMSCVARLDGRVRRALVGALIILDGLVDHSRLASVVDAARRGRVPIAYAGKGGIASLETALLKLDEMVG